MRAAYCVSILCVSGLMAFSAQAQTTTTQQPSYYVVPAGNATSSGSLFNQNAQPLPLQQMIAGQNAPSYNYGTTTQAYTGSSGRNTSIGVMSPEQARSLNRQREANALAYQNEYLASLGQAAMGQQQPTSSSAYQGSAFSNLYAGEKKKVPTKRRVVNKSMNDPLATPPRLFNLD